MPSSKPQVADQPPQVLSLLPAEIAAQVSPAEAAELVHLVAQQRDQMRVLRRLPLQDEEPALPIQLEDLS